MKQALCIKASLILILGLGLVAALLWLLDCSTTSVTAASAAELHVCPSGCAYSSVQAAVDAASEGDVIKVAGGDYTGVQARPAPAGYVGPAVITQVVYVTKTVTIQGGYTTTNWLTPYPVTQPTTLDAQGQGRVLFIAGDISPTIEGLHITGGDADGLGGSYYGDDAGGGVCVITATAVISNNWVFSNTAEDSGGGGMYLCDSAAIVNENSITSNTAYMGGGLDLSYSAALLTHNTIASNTASGGGGGLNLLFSEATVSGNIIVSNTADFGGGVFLEWGDDTLNDNTISFNTADTGGGGVYMWYTEAAFSNDTVTSNTADVGVGGLCVEGSSATLTNTIVADNQANSFGSGLLVISSLEDHPSLVRLLHATIARNSGGDGSGIYVRYGDAPGIVVLTNTILVSHTVGISVTGENTATLEATLWGTGAWANETDWGGEGTIITGTPSHNYWADPGFVNPDGGDYHIGPGSAAVDAGVDAGVMTDIDGQARDAAPDLGADERSGPCFARLNDGPVYPTVQGAVDGSTHPTDVIKVAGYCAGVGVRPAPAGYMGPSVITQVVYVTKTVTIQGGYTTTNWLTPYPITQPTTLDAQGQGRVFLIAGDISPTIEGLRITGGDADGLGGGPTGDDNAGGGVYIITATAVVSDNQVFSNSAYYGGGLWLDSSDAVLFGNTVTSNTADDSGGGLGLWRSAALLSDNTVASNTADVGGGLHLVESEATLNGNVIVSNTADAGGGLFLNLGSDTLNNNIISSNTAHSEFGGGVAMWYTEAAFSDNAVISNAADWGGGGLYVEGSNATLTNTVIADNQISGFEGSGLLVLTSSEGYPSLVRLIHATIARNTGGDGSGIHVGPGDYDTFNSVILTNTILVSHTVGITVTGGNTATLEATLWGTGDWANETDWGGYGTIITGTSSYNHWADPSFVNPDGGDYHIGPGSAAVDAGVDAGVMTDIDGQARDAAPDLGADEWVYVVYLPLVLR